jgi:DmsE family decaheme c-type cytochrome
VLKGDAVCTRCHDESETYPVLSIARTKHGTRADNRTPTCTNCHSVSETHVNKPADAKDRPAPECSFGKKSKTPADAQSAACLTCHEGKTRMFWHEGTHASRDVTCTNCHQIHTGHDKVRDRKEQAGVCFDCHKDKRMQAMKPSRRPILEGKVVCSDCHNPHGSPRRQVTVRQPHRAPQLARRDVDQHQVHRPAAEPVLGLRRRPGRQLGLASVVAAHARPMYGDLAAVEADLAFGRAPALADAVLAAAIRGSGQLLRIIAEHLLDRADAGRQTEPLEGPIHILPSHLETGHERERWGRGSVGHGVALLYGFDTRSLAAQGGQRLPP